MTWIIESGALMSVIVKGVNIARQRLFHGSRPGIAGEIAPIIWTECDLGKVFYLEAEERDA